MTYDEVLASIHSRKPFSSTASLERITRLMERLGNPQETLRCVHVAGTNGKGSTCAMIESALRAAGFHTGLFTSPYLVDFRERIQLDRQMIRPDFLIECYQIVMETEKRLEREGYEPINEFELVTAMGFLAFSLERVDYAVIEVGLGGRADATNVISQPEVCCITPISLDHMAVLGNTVAEIAAEKAGIIKNGCPVVITRQDPNAIAVFQSVAGIKGARLFLTDPPRLRSCDLNGLSFSYRDQTYTVPLLGKYQADNAAAAIEACNLLGIPSAAIQEGLRSVSWPGRLQLVKGNPSLLIDAGHNPAGIAALSEALDQLFPGKRIISVMAMMRDKDYSFCIPEIARRSGFLVATTVGLPRSLPPMELERVAAPYCTTITAPSVSEGISLARNVAGEDDLILVCGSVYASGEAIGQL